MTERTDRGPGVRGAELAEARALGDPTRAAIHRHLLRATAPVTIAELADATGVHHTAVRQHLTKLCAAGLADRQVLPPEGRGRPRLAYTGIDHPQDQPYRLLAGMFADALRTGRTPREVGSDVGRAAGTRAARIPVDPVDVLVDEARRLGFAPVVVEPGRRGDEGADRADDRAGLDGTAEIELHACPYVDLAANDPASVCSLHLGMAEGVAEAVGGVVVLGLDPDGLHGGACRFRVQRTGVPGAAAVAPAAWPAR